MHKRRNRSIRIPRAVYERVNFAEDLQNQNGLGGHFGLLGKE
jgi:hypothetical protein